MPRAEDWPHAGDSIFSAGKAERFHAKMDLAHWGVYPLAYLHAAEWLVGSIDSGANSDLIVYPVLYLYRHYLELMLKNLISLGRNLDFGHSEEPEGHRLKDLWGIAREVIAKHAFRPDEKQDDLTIVGSVILEFASLDPYGETFRYAAYKNGKETLGGHDHVCLDEIVRVMKRVDKFFVGVESVLDELIKHQADVNSESF